MLFLIRSVLDDDPVAISQNKDVTHNCSRLSDVFNNWKDVFANDFWGTPMKSPGSHKSFRVLENSAAYFYTFFHFIFHFEAPHHLILPRQSCNWWS